ncbi:hypothetical protein M0R36_05195 [bacterium]|nr:hypothetical protein [bacterium]
MSAPKYEYSLKEGVLLRELIEPLKEGDMFFSIFDPMLREWVPAKLRLETFMTSFPISEEEANRILSSKSLKTL